MIRTTLHLERLSRLVEGGLADALKAVDEAPRVLHDAIHECVFGGGKRFRPLLCLGACEAAGEPTRRALAAACAIELIHTYSLVHDDLPAMDNAEQRRGRPSCHRAFGEAAAILVGDALLTLAFERLGTARVSHVERVVATLAEAGGTMGLIGGQWLDLEHASDKQETAHDKEEPLKEIAKKKTGALIAASVVIGGLAAGAPEHVLNRLRQYGQYIGLAFQLVDDAHDGDGLVPVMGAPGVRREAAGLIRQAVETLSTMGRRAEALRELAAWLAGQAKETHARA